MVYIYSVRYIHIYIYSAAHFLVRQFQLNCTVHVHVFHDIISSLYVFSLSRVCIQLESYLYLYILYYSIGQLLAQSYLSIHNHVSVVA